MKNIHLLPTNKPSRLVIDTIENKLYYQPILHNKTVNVLTQHIYITSDEKIKEGEWCILLENHYVHGGVGKYNTNKAVDFGLHNTSFFKKIILTTDQDLIKDNVQAVDDEFLEWFVKNPSCESVEIKWVKTPDGIFYHQDNVPYGCYKIIIPKEELMYSEKYLKEKTLLAMISIMQEYSIINESSVVQFHEEWFEQFKKK